GKVEGDGAEPGEDRQQRVPHVDAAAQSHDEQQGRAVAAHRVTDGVAADMRGGRRQRGGPQRSVTIDWYTERRAAFWLSLSRGSLRMAASVDIDSFPPSSLLSADKPVTWASSRSK